MARIVADRGTERILGSEGQMGYWRVFEMSCGCRVRIDERMLTSTASYSGLMNNASRVAEAHFCNIVVDHASPQQRRPERIPWSAYVPNRESLTFMDMPISATERALREFYSAPYPPPVRPASNPLGFKPEQLDALKAKPPEPPKKPEPKDRFDLIEID